MRLLTMVTFGVILAGLVGCGGSPATLPIATTSDPQQAAADSTATRSVRGRDLYVVHGFLANDSSTAPLAQEMKESGMYRRVFNVAYPCNQSVRTSGHELAELIRQTSDPAGGADLIGHSMGGLVVRWAVEMSYASGYVHNIVTLGTPHLGANAAFLANALLNNPQQWKAQAWPEAAAMAALNTAGYADALTDLLPDSSTIKQLNAPSHTSCDYFSLAGRVQPIPGLPVGIPTDLVVNVSNANWPGLANEGTRWKSYILAVNHCQLIRDPKAIRQIKLILWQERNGSTA